MQAVRPTHRPAEISVPVRTMAPPIPSAIGSFAAVSEMMLMMDGSLMNAGTLMAMKITALAMMMYMALLISAPLIARRLSAPSMALNSAKRSPSVFFLTALISDMCPTSFTRIWRRAP